MGAPHGFNKHGFNKSNSFLGLAQDCGHNFSSPCGLSMARALTCWLRRTRFSLLSAPSLDLSVISANGMPSAVYYEGQLESTSPPSPRRSSSIDGLTDDAIDEFFPPCAEDLEELAIVEQYVEMLAYLDMLEEEQSFPKFSQLLKRWESRRKEVRERGESLVIAVTLRPVLYLSRILTPRHRRRAARTQLTQEPKPRPASGRYQAKQHPIGYASLHSEEVVKIDAHASRKNIADLRGRLRWTHQSSKSASKRRNAKQFHSKNRVYQPRKMN